jgi:curved DNA-binding protein CbpA
MFSNAKFIVSDLLEWQSRHPGLIDEWIATHVAFERDDIGSGIIQFASGRIPQELTESVAAPLNRDIEFAARRVVAKLMFGATATHWIMLGVSRDFDASVLRENYRRLMALVHPDIGPKGFPPDAATRLNKAYEILCDAHTREVYQSHLQETAPNVALATSHWNAATNGSPSMAAAVHKPLGRRFFSALLPRRGLLWFAFALLATVGISVFFWLNGVSDFQIVERELERVRSETALAATDSASNSASEFSPTEVAAGIARITGGSAAKSVTPAPSTVSRLPVATATGKVSAAVAPNIDPPDKSIATSSSLSGPPKNEPIRTSPNVVPVPVASQQSAAALSNVRGNEPTAMSAVTSEVKSAVVTTVARSVEVAPIAIDQSILGGNSSAVVADSELLAKRSRGAEDVLLAFVSAFDTGAAVGLDQVMAPHMPRRAEILGQYEQLFASTRQRTMRLKQLTHRLVDDRLVTAGYATVTTTDRVGSTAVQQIYLEIEISSGQRGPRIERLVSYQIN